MVLSASPHSSLFGLPLRSSRGFLPVFFLLSVVFSAFLLETFCLFPSVPLSVGPCPGFVDRCCFLWFAASLSFPLFSWGWAFSRRLPLRSFFFLVLFRASWPAWWSPFGWAVCLCSVLYVASFLVFLRFSTFLLSAFLLGFPLSFFFDRGVFPRLVVLPLRLLLFHLPSRFLRLLWVLLLPLLLRSFLGLFAAFWGASFCPGFLLRCLCCGFLGSAVWLCPRVFPFGLFLVFCLCVVRFSSGAGSRSIPWSFCVAFLLSLAVCVPFVLYFAFSFCTLFSWECESGGLALFIAFLHVASFEGASCAGMPDPEVSGSA